jgi:dTDP-glucose pyrophosphorylase
MDFKKIIINRERSVLEALEVLNSLPDNFISRLILFVCTNKQEIIGSLTDGDIRRAILNGSSLNAKVDEICNRNFKYANETEGYLGLDNYRKENLKIIPLLDNNKVLSRIIDLEKKKALLPVECMIMAGGRGKRLSPLTDSVPKPMLSLGNKPIIEHNIDRLIEFGINKIYISVKYLGEQIEKYFGDGSSKGIEIEYVWEDKELGTAGSLSLLKNIKTDNILLFNSDLFTNINIEEMYLNLLNNNADMAIASKDYNVDVPYAVFDINDNIISSFKEKPSFRYFSNAGIYLFKKEFLDQIPSNTFYNITDLMDKLIDNGKKLIHVPIRGFWIDIGNSVQYNKAQEMVKYLK